MASISKMVSDRADISNTVVSSITVQGPEVAADVEKILFPDGLPKHLTVAQLFTALGDALGRSVHELTAADLANAQELSDDDAPRAERDAAVAAVRERLINARGLLTSVYGASILKAYGLTGELPDDTQQLVRHAGHVASQLTSRPITEAPKQEGASVDPKAVGRGLAAAAKKLETALGDVQREEREAQLTLKRRNAAMAVWSDRYQGVADATTGLFELAGRADLAELVRPTARRRAGLTEAGDVPAGAAAGDKTATNGATAPAATPAAPNAALKLTPAGPDAEIAAPKLPIK
jgi:hypothetical protein